MMSESRRQHPVAALEQLLQIIRQNWLTILLVLFVGGQQTPYSFFSPLVILGLFVVLLLLGVASWWRFTYRVENGELRIERGLLVRRNLYIPRERIQVIDITSGVIERLFGLVSLSVQTASGSQNAKISALTHEEAGRLRDIMRPDRQQAGDVERGEEQEEEVREYELSARQLALAAFTSGSIGVTLSIVGTLFSQIDQLLPEHWIEQQAEQVAHTGWMLLLGGLILVVGLALLLAFLGTVIRFAGFKLQAFEDRIIISHGLFERKQLTIPYNRIQAIRINEGILRQPFGLATLQVDSAGFGQENGESTVLWPLMRRKDIQPFLREILPDYSGSPQWIRPAPRAVFRYIFKSSFVIFVLTVLAGLTFEYGWWTALFLVPAACWGWARYLDAGVAYAGEQLFLRFRALSRTTVVLYRRRIQDAEIRYLNPAIRRTLHHLKVTIAAGRTGANFEVEGLERRNAYQLLQWCLNGSGEVRSAKEGEGKQYNSSLDNPADGTNTDCA